MCDYRYGFLRCEGGELEGMQVLPRWAMWCPECNAPQMLRDALSYSLIAFQQALQLCATRSPEAARQWISSVAQWPAQVVAVEGDVTVTREQATTMLNDAMDAAGHGQLIEIAAVANELHFLGNKLQFPVPDCEEMPEALVRWHRSISEIVDSCRDRLNELTKPKEHT